MKYYINGFSEGERYFKSFLTREEFEKAMNGEVITKNGNEFYIENDEAE